MASENETVAEIVKRVRRDCNSYPLPTAAAEMLKLVREIEAAHRREVAELRDLLKTMLPFAETGYCTRSAKKKKTHGCTGCPLSSIVSGTQYDEPICKLFKWRKALEGTNDEGK